VIIYLILLRFCYCCARAGVL